MKKRVKALLAMGVLIGLSLVGLETRASVEKIFLAGDGRIDPETGQSKPRILNPNGLVDSTFTPMGVRLSYLDTRSVAQSVDIVAEFPRPPYPDPDVDGKKLHNKLMAEELSGDGGRIAVGNTLRFVVGLAKNNNSAVMLSLKREGKLGFVHSSFGTQEIDVVLKDYDTRSLDRAVYTSLKAVIRERVEAEAGSKAAGEKAVPPRGNMGFLFNQKADGVGGPQGSVTCASVFSGNSI